MPNRGLAVAADHRVKLKESEKKDKYLDLVRELGKLWNMKMTVILTVIVSLGSQKRIGTGSREHGNNRTSGDHPDFCIIEIGQNTD